MNVNEKVIYHWAVADKIKVPGLYFLYRTDDEELVNNDHLYLVEIVQDGSDMAVRWAGAYAKQPIMDVDPECRFLGPIARKIF